MNTIRTVIRLSIILVVAVACVGCVEGKVGIGPFKAVSVEVGPGGVEAKGPSAGPLKAGSAEAGPGGAETKGLSAGPFKTKKAKSQMEKDE